jgi:CheY-like chemotaxis protein
MAKILVVDDDDLSRQVIHQMVETLGHEAASVASGSEAVAACREHAFDLIVTDLLMPDQDGIELIRELRQLRPDTPILAVSGGGRITATDYLASARQLGAVGVLAKPFSRTDLREALERAL